MPVLEENPPSVHSSACPLPVLSPGSGGTQLFPLVQLVECFSYPLPGIHGVLGSETSIVSESNYA